jgi:hypothetical protein
MTQPVSHQAAWRSTQAFIAGTGLDNNDSSPRCRRASREFIRLNPTKSDRRNYEPDP